MIILVIIKRRRPTNRCRECDITDMHTLSCARWTPNALRRLPENEGQAD